MDNYYTEENSTLNQIYYDSTNCWYRLPCGICTKTNSVCPFYTYKITWTCGNGISTVYSERQIKGEKT